MDFGAALKVEKSMTLMLEKTGSASFLEGNSMFRMSCIWLSRIFLVLLVPGMVLATPRASRETPTIRWQSCYPESGLPFRCGSVEVPIDYNWPNGDKLTLALVKLPAARPGRKIGSLFFNPGGPGNSGVDFVLGVAPLLSPELRNRFDLIGFDPRGIARSNPLLCFDHPVSAPPFFFPLTPADEVAVADFDTALAIACKSNGSDVVDHMSTANVARDLDRMRRAVRDRKLSYVGYSYGAFIGVTYANMYPNKVRAMVLDGVFNPIAYTTGVGDRGRTLPVTTRLRSDAGFQATLNEFFRLCDQAGLAQCAFANAAATRFASLASHVRAVPVRIVDAKAGTLELTYDRFIVTVGGALTSGSGEWPLLANALNEIETAVSVNSEEAASRAGAAFAALNDALGGAASTDDKALSGGQFGVVCSDSINPNSHMAWSAAGDASDANVGYFGRSSTWASSPCAVWLGNDQDRYLGPFSRRTRHPVLIVGNRFDPVTRYEGAEKVHSLLLNSGLLTLEGWGHTSLFLSTCVDQAVARYLTTARIPAAEATCGQDAVPFADTEAVTAGETVSKAARLARTLKMPALDGRADARRRAMHSILGHKPLQEIPWNP